MSRDLYVELDAIGLPFEVVQCFLIYIGMPSMWSNALCPVKIAHKSNVCASSSWCINQRLRLFPKRHVWKTLASILSEKATTVIKEEREICLDFVALNRLSLSRRLVTQTKLD